MILAAIKSGTDPVAPLPPAAFHRTLEEPIYCPKCEATYMLVTDYDWAISRHFESESRRHISMLRKTIFRVHVHNHHITHLETNGVVVTAHAAQKPPTPLEALPPATKLIN
jgi:hypothetical protein